MPLISIIVPIYKAKIEHLKDCIESLIKQTYSNIEIILINDGCPWNSGKVCDELADNDKRILVIHQENQGVSVARNKGINVARGKYLMFVDADDWIDRETCAILKSEIDLNSNLDILLFSLKTNVNGQVKENPFWLEENLKLSREDIQELQLQILYKTISKYSPPYNMIGVVACKLYKTNFVKENNLQFDPNVVVSEDGIFAFKAFEHAKEIGYLNKFLYFYRKHENSATARYRENAIDDYTYSLVAFNSVLEEYKRDRRYISALHLRAIRNIAAISDQYILNEKNQLNLMERIKLTKKVCSMDIYKNAIKMMHTTDYFRNSGSLQKVYFILLKNKCYLTYYYTKKIFNKVRK